VHLATTFTPVALPTTVADTGSFSLALIGFLVHQLSGKTPELFCNMPLLYEQEQLQFYNYTKFQIKLDK
jgi:hypothetical protein